MVAEEFEVISQNGVVVDVEAEVDKLHALFRERTKLIHSLKDPKELEEQQVNVARQNLFSELAKLPFQERALARLKINFKSDECNKLVEEADDDDDDDEGIEEETVENLCTIIKSKECRREIASAFDFARDNHYQAVPPGVFGEALKSFKTKAEEAYNGVSRFGGPSLKQQQFKKFSDSIQEKVDDKVQHNGERYKDSKVANAVNDSYSKYEKMMKPDLLSQLQGADRIKHVQGQHDEARKAAMQHFESEISEFGGEPVIVEKRDILKKMIEDRYEDLQTNNAIQGVQEMAREIVEKTAQEFQTILAQSLSGLVDETSMELSVTKARMRIESTYGLHTQTLLDNPGLAKLDKKTVEAFLNNFKQARLETQLTKEEAQFKSQAQLFLAGKVTEKKIAELQKHATEAEEAFSREREDHERRMKNNEDLIDAEKKRSEKLLEEAKEDIAFKKEMQRLRLEFEMKKDENERLGELKKQEMINAIEEKRIRMQETAAAARARQTDEELRQTQKATDMRFQQNKEQMLYEKEIRINQLKREEAAEAAKREADEKREERMHEQELRQLEAASKERREKLQQEHEAKIREIERLAAKDAKEAAEIEATKAANAQRHAAEMKRLDEETTARIEDQRIAQAEQKEKIRAERERADQQAKREMEAIRVKNELARKKLEMEEKREADRLAADKVNKAREAAEREAASKHKREMEDKEQKKRHEKWWQKII
ncbi:unnamed protein product, partial [Mesorhabditis belari]|uniref:Uncharacterized protein n=1 Tax=Mesorhabditis belari TaxID=2138241 RepID=A0AAF3F3S6_9BILA